MVSRSTFTYDGLFFLEGFDISGHIKFPGPNTRLKLVGNFHYLIGRDSFDLYGTLSDGTRASLHQCINMGSIRFAGSASRSIELDIFPHYIVVGHDYIEPSEARVSKISHQFSGLDLLCAFGKSFSILHPTRDNLQKLLEDDHEPASKTPASDSHPPDPNATPIGPDPVVAYYNGVYEISEIPTPGAKVTISNNLSYRSPTAKGVKLSGNITSTIDFDESATLATAVQELISVQKFYEILLGSRRKYKSIEITISGASTDYTPSSKLYWNFCNEGLKKNKYDIHPADIPALASINQTSFQRMLGNWMDGMPEMRPARYRLLGGMTSKSYSYDRIIGAANMFDLLPKDRVPKEDELSADLSDKISDTRRDFKALPASPVRDSILSILGRAGKPSLRSKINYRAEIVQKASDNRFQGIDFVCHQAVLCRNHYVHGSAPGFDYEGNFQSFAFLTETLEFVFATSDLIECGWDAADYFSRGGSATHPFCSYAIAYEANIAALRAAIF